ncbi:hypothetical protein FA15DRAFT_650031 [Coprinopsis marcescibilis]|uniref:Nephrocystin 3-like N-terminal domain-containing protein n=1 Tax=Coprinopsis marcescibilis TaxID=230819 RepID=A0A5C3KDY3_COPMA|nr:hypothetical protein FA15DRAFT_650031 [Coprinopsis marcescibilis]
MMRRTMQNLLSKNPPNRQEGSTETTLADQTSDYGSPGSESVTQEGPSAKTTSIAKSDHPNEVDQGTPESRLSPEAAPEAILNEIKHDPKAVPPLIKGGILNGAQGVHIEGSAQLISAQNYINVYNTVLQRHSPEKDEELFWKIIAWISDINYHAIQADNFEKRAAGTGQWAFDDPIIGKWLEGALGVLWGIGMPGAGKTIISSIIINHLTQKAKANKRICVAYAFARYTDLFTGEQVLGGLLRQIVQDHPSTLPFVKPMYFHHLLHGTRPNQLELLATIRAIFDSDLFDQKYCSLDGLDEAFDDTQVDVLDGLSHLPANLLIMSRPLPLLKERVPEATFIDIIVHESDIKQMIEEKISRLRKLRGLLEKGDWKEKVLKTVLERSSGMFLVASLQLDMLSRCMHLMDLRSALEALPVGVNAMYEATMKRITEGQGCDLALRAVTWVIYARKTLRMSELRHALAVNTATFKYSSDLLVDAETLLSVCCGLITYERETKLVHYTAHDFLVAYLSKPGVDVQATLACTCIARLRNCGFANYKHRITQNYSSRIFVDRCFLAYAHRKWAAHADSASIPAFVEKFVLQCQRFPWNHPSFDEFDFLNSIQLAAACNFHQLLAPWLGAEPSRASQPSPPTLNVNSKSAHGRTALALASMNGHIEAVKLLIEAEGVSIQCSDHKGWSPLIAASHGGHVRVVDLLLGAVAVDHVNAGSWTALMEAASLGHTEVIKSLLRVQGINVNAREPVSVQGKGDSALTLAACNGHLAAVQLLLGADGIEVNASHWEYGTALAQASRWGHTGVVAVFLQRHDVDVNSSQCEEGTALMQAVEMDRMDIVELLLKHDKIDVNATRSDRSSALSLALARKRLEIIELLKGHGEK